MEKTYILLRSNKQQGPFTLAQLAKMDLHPEDLVNIQGGIVGWQYAQEIDVLKPYLSGYLAPVLPVADTHSTAVPNTAPLPVKDVEQHQTLSADVPRPVEPSVPKAGQGVSRVEESAPKVEPDIAKSSGVFASFPPGTELSPSGRELKSATSVSVGHATKASVMKPATIPSPKATPDTDSVPLKEKTVSAREPVRTRSSSVARRKKLKPAVVLSSLLALGILAFAVGEYGTRNDKDLARKDESGNMNMASSSSSDTAVEDNRAALQQELPIAQPTEETKASMRTDKSSPSATPVVDDNGPDKQVLAPATDSQQKTLSDVAESEATELAKPVAKEPAKASPDLTEQIYLKSNFVNNELGEGVFDLSISMDNKSDKLLKTVAVNVFYTDSDGKTLNKQTIYFSNVKPGETIARPASQHKLATRVRCELGLVSSEGLLYYSN